MRADVVSAALPPLKAAVPRELTPSKNCTVPVGPEEGLTVAVNVTCCPEPDGFNDDATTVVVLAALTVCVREGDVLPVKFASPLYLALMECAPTVRADVVSDALPPFKAAVPREFAPSKNCTVPVAAEGDTDGREGHRLAVR